MGVTNEIFRKAIKELNKTKLLTRKLELEGNTTDPEQRELFMEAIEEIPEELESKLPDLVVKVYNEFALEYLRENRRKKEELEELERRAKEAEEKEKQQEEVKEKVEENKESNKKEKEIKKKVEKTWKKVEKRINEVKAKNKKRTKEGVVNGVKIANMPREGVKRWELMHIAIKKNHTAKSIVDDEEILELYNKRKSIIKNDFIRTFGGEKITKEGE